MVKEESSSFATETDPLLGNNKKKNQLEEQPPPLVGNNGAAAGIQSMTMNRNDRDDNHFKGDFTMEDSPSYEILSSHNLLVKEHRVASETELVLTPPNSTRCKNTLLGCCLGPLGCVFKGFEVPNGTIKAGYDGRGNYSFFGPGVHSVLDPYFSVQARNLELTRPVIVNGDCTIVTVDQGFVGYCLERGQPVLLPPGMHQWRSATLKFQRLIDLNQPVIELGPMTLLTIDQGYMAVTQDNGKQVILDGGSVYLLTHRNWKFEKFVSTKIQTDELKRIEAASGDNVVMLVDATVLWRISDVETAVRMSAETMSADGSRTKQTVAKLRNDVLKQAEASLAFFVGSINFSDGMAAAAMNQRTRASGADGNIPVAFAERDTADSSSSPPQESGRGGGGGSTSGRGGSSSNVLLQATAGTEFNIYNTQKLQASVDHANEITATYGVEIISINIISAIPADKKLQESLAAGAVAAAEAQMMETAAQGKSQAMQIEAKAQAEHMNILAKASAEAEVTRATGAKDAADLLAANPVSVDLAKIDRTGQALAGKGNHASFFFGGQPQDLQGLLANRSVVKGADGIAAPWPTTASAENDDDNEAE